MAGKLYVVGLPIGNLEDTTPRAMRVLSEVDAVLCEDTREIHRFFALKSLPTPRLLSYRDQTHDRQFGGLLDMLQQGKDLALVSDRGTPTISDPGYKLVRDAVDAGYEVVSVPGASAAIAALAISGLPTDKFTFLGFLPRTPGKQKALLELYGNLPATFIIFESPFRVHKLVQNIVDALGPDTHLALAHEITKLHESLIRGKAGELLPQLAGKKLKGEWVVMGRKLQP